MRRLTRNAMLIALAGATAFGGWQLLRGRGVSVEAFVPPAPAVRAATVERREIADRVEALGTTSSWESIEVRPTVTEFVSEIHFTDGQAVTRGDALATLAQQEESAQLDEARAYLDEQLREVRRIEGLVARKSLPQSQLDERRTLRDIALARVVRGAGGAGRPYHPRAVHRAARAAQREPRRAGDAGDGDHHAR
jgi:multidrug efflux pump subunit AcrA (membrane-fusion protein)